MRISKNKNLSHYNFHNTNCNVMAGLIQILDIPEYKQISELWWFKEEEEEYQEATKGIRDK